MTNPTRQQIANAHEALLELCRLAEELAVTEGQARQAWKYHAAILTALPPKPRPTMAEIEWDDELHYLAEAENEGWGKVLMLGMDHESRGVTILVKTGNVVYLPCAKPQSLTPTGKRYTLTEVQDD